MRLIIKYLFFIFVLVGTSSLEAQSTNNPFELKYRESNQSSAETTGNPFEIPQQENQDSSKKQETLSKSEKKSSDSDNPFDIIKKPSTAITTSPASASSAIKTPVPSSEKTIHFLFWVTFFLLLFFTTVISVSRKRLEQIYGSFKNDNLLRQVYRSNKNLFSISYILLYLLFFVNLGLFVFLSAEQFEVILPRSFSFLLLLCLGAGLVFATKHLLLLLIRSIFPITKEIQLYSFTIMVFSIILGIVLFPLNMLIAYAPPWVGEITIHVALGAILAIYIFRTLRGLAIGSKYLVLHKFHFFLYLCAVEILPVIVLLKIISLRIE